MVRCPYGLAVSVPVSRLDLIQNLDLDREKVRV